MFISAIEQICQVFSIWWFFVFFFLIYECMAQCLILPCKIHFNLGGKMQYSQSLKIKSLDLFDVNRSVTSFHFTKKAFWRISENKKGVSHVRGPNLNLSVFRFCVKSVTLTIFLISTRQFFWLHITIFLLGVLLFTS